MRTCNYCGLQREDEDLHLAQDCVDALKAERDQLKAEVERLKQAESIQFESRSDYAERLHAAELQNSDLKEKNADLRRIYEAACEVFDCEETQKNALEDLAVALRDYEKKNGLVK